MDLQLEDIGVLGINSTKLDRAFPYVKRVGRSYERGFVSKKF